jgi:hypothetical protein
MTFEGEQTVKLPESLTDRLVGIAQKDPYAHTNYSVQADSPDGGTTRWAKEGEAHEVARMVPSLRAENPSLTNWRIIRVETWELTYTHSVISPSEVSA